MRVRRVDLGIERERIVPYERNAKGLSRGIDS